MSKTRLSLWAGGAALLAAWLSSAAGTTPGEVPPPGGASAPLPSQALSPPTGPAAVERIDLDRDVARMAAWLERAPRPRPVVRNPFTLAPRRRADAPGGSGMVVPEGWAPGPAAAAPAARLRVSLAGIATEAAPSGPLRTAILSVDGQVMLAQVGDEVPGPYQVQRVDDDAVELFDPARQTSFRLTLP